MCRISSCGWDVLRQGDLPLRLCTDAHLVALAITKQWRLVSLDDDFQRLPKIHLDGHHPTRGGSDHAWLQKASILCSACSFVVMTPEP
nr:hypothetical protein [Synechococcus sp. A15-127]